MKGDDDVQAFNPERYGVVLTVGKILGIFVGTIYFVVFVYQMRDAISANIVANNENQKVQMVQLAEQTKLLKQIVCQNQWNLYYGISGARYKGECEKL